MMCNLLPWCGGFTSTGLLFMPDGNMEGSSGGSDCFLKLKETRPVKHGEKFVGQVNFRDRKIVEDAPEKSVERATAAIATGVIMIVGGVAALSLATYLLFLATKTKKMN